MGALEDMREELLGETLGQVKLLRDEVAIVTGKLNESTSKLDETANLAIMKILNRSENFADEVKKNATGLSNLAAQVRSASDTILGEIAIRQYDEAHKMHTEALHQILKNHLPAPQSHWKNQVVLVVSSSLCTALVCLLGFLFLRGTFGI